MRKAIRILVIATSLGCAAARPLRRGVWGGEVFGATQPSMGEHHREIAAVNAIWRAGRASSLDEIKPRIQRRARAPIWATPT